MFFPSQYQYRRHLHHNTSMPGWLCPWSQFNFGINSGMYLGIDPSHNIPILCSSVNLSSTLQIGTALYRAIPWYIPEIMTFI